MIVVVTLFVIRAEAVLITINTKVSTHREAWTTNLILQCCQSTKNKLDSLCATLNCANTQLKW